MPIVEKRNTVKVILTAPELHDIIRKSAGIGSSYKVTSSTLLLGTNEEITIEFLEKDVKDQLVTRGNIPEAETEYQKAKARRKAAEGPRPCPECGEFNCDPEGVGHYRG